MISYPKETNMEGFGIKLRSTVLFYNKHFSFFEFFEKSRRCQMVLQHNGTSPDKWQGLIKKLILPVSS